MNNRWTEWSIKEKLGHTGQNQKHRGNTENSIHVTSLLHNAILSKYFFVGKTLTLKWCHDHSLAAQRCFHNTFKISSSLKLKNDHKERNINSLCSYIIIIIYSEDYLKQATEFSFNTYYFDQMLHWTIPIITEDRSQA